MEQNPNQPGMVFYNYNPVDGTITSTATPVQIEFGSSDVARQINQQVQLQYSNMQGIQAGQTQQIVITSQPTFDTTEDIDPLLIKASKRKMRSNGERVPCETCGKTFSCNANLRDHTRLHTGERPFQCSECGMSFAQRSNWRLHKRVHTGERPFMCGICGKTFSRSSHLPEHIRVHTGERPYQCSSCSHSFSSSQALKNHMRTHTGEKPYFCDSCSTSFTHSSTLSSHRKRCTGEKRKRGRPIGAGRRRKKSLSRSRRRPRKGRFAKRRKKPEASAEVICVKEEMEDPTLVSVSHEDAENIINGVPPKSIDVTVDVNTVNDEHKLTEPLLCNESAAGSNCTEALLCNITSAAASEQALMCNIAEATNGEVLLCNVGQASNADDVICNLADNSNQNVSIDPTVDFKHIMIKNEIEDFNDLANVNELKAHISSFRDPSDLRQEAAVAMTTLHHGVVNNLPVDGEDQTLH